MPNFGHVADLVAGELHHVDVVGPRTSSGRIAGAAATGVRAREHPISGDIVALAIDRKGLQLVASVRKDHHQTLHPVGVLRERLYTNERFGLCGEGRVGRAIGLAGFPSPSCLAFFEKALGNGRNHCHRAISLMVATPHFGRSATLNETTMTNHGPSRFQPALISRYNAITFR